MAVSLIDEGAAKIGSMAFVSGLSLNERFYREVVESLLGSRPHAAGLVGWGSDVLGYDDERSTDHGWGLRLLVLVDADQVDEVRAVVDAGLPESYEGWPVKYGWDSTPFQHHVEVRTLAEWLVDRLGVDASRGLSTEDWLAIPSQRLLEVTAGAVFRDDDGSLNRIRAELSWYPDDAWRRLLARRWQRLADEEAFVGRADEVGDALGAALIAARQVGELIHLWFLCTRMYAPYAKWFGTAFRSLPGADQFAPLLEAVLAARSAAERDRSLAAAYEMAARRFNELGLVDPLSPTVRPYHQRPYSVLMADRFAGALLADE